MHNLLPFPNASGANRTARLAALLAAWWMAALVSGVWGWGMDDLSPHDALSGVCAALRVSGAADPASGPTLAVSVPDAPVCKCAMCPGGAKCCCKAAHEAAPGPLSRAETGAITARCEDAASGPNAAPLVLQTWHTPVYFAAPAAPRFPRLSGRAGFAAPVCFRLTGRTPAPLCPPPLSFA